MVICEVRELTNSIAQQYSRRFYDMQMQINDHTVDFVNLSDGLEALRQEVRSRESHSRRFHNLQMQIDDHTVDFVHLSNGLDAVRREVRLRENAASLR